ncbi:tetratricopeptide repeat protein, partial [Amycolatopsis sp. H20-H5]|uniref:tetratricopeptide repeat protein n=1 Tax=Amycolatopsis sp. H20-H5 TaxID=3046309 RepID=UPI002DBB4D0B
SFSAKLEAGDVVDGRYDVLGCFARGGLGFVYLATDRRLGGHVALKGLINTNNTAAVRIAESESQVLTSLEHPNIVRIFDVVTHPDRYGESEGASAARYIVMDFVDGLSLREVKNRNRTNDESPEGRLLVEHVVAYGREILTALDYLHGQQLLYCDMKPDNVIHGEKRIKLIDFGAIRKLGDHDSPRVGTVGYEVGEQEKKTYGLTVRSDIHTVGRTLRELFLASDGQWLNAESGGVGFGVESFKHVLDRAVAPFDQRFATAQEMLVQLDGVLNEILSLRDRGSRPTISTLFTESAVLLDAGLGQAPPLEHWTTGLAAPLGATPSAHDIALGLPIPREDPDDGLVDYLRTVRAPDAARLLKKLDSAGVSVEVEFRKCRAWLELGKLAEATTALSAAVKLLAKRAPHDWRVYWHRGLLALVSDDVAAAHKAFDAVYRDIPGEETPKLALGLCLELQQNRAGAERHFDALWVCDSSQVNAAFGLARIHLSRQEPARAVAVLDQVPEFSRYDEAARIAGVRVLAGTDLGEAVVRLSALDVEEDLGDRLVTVLRKTALDVVDAGGTAPVTEGEVLGKNPTEAHLRKLLDESYRHLAPRAPSAEHHDVLIDLANSVRPVTLV